MWDAGAKTAIIVSVRAVGITRTKRLARGVIDQRRKKKIAGNET